MELPKEIQELNDLLRPRWERRPRRAPFRPEDAREGASLEVA